MGRAVRIALVAAIFVLAMLLISQCAYNAGEWVGRN
jgi:hypothetical protein